MKSSIESVSGVEKRIRVEVPADEVSRRIEEGYAEVRKVAPLRGFRKGKAPMSMVRRVFKESVEADVAEHLVRNSLAEAVKENDLKVLSLPKIDGGKLMEGQEFVFTATVEVVPEVKPEGYKGIPVARENAEVKDEEVEASLRRLRDSFAQFHAVEGRGAGGSDLVEFGFTATSEGETVEKGESASVILEGGVPFGKEFESHLMGARAGDEKVFEVSGNPDNGASVDTNRCTTTGDGSDSLCTVWQDPDFDRAAPAFYYARVVQNPTCRWHTYLCNAQGVDCSRPETVGAGFEPCCDPLYPRSIQERAWTSPIWYVPAEAAVSAGPPPQEVVP